MSARTTAIVLCSLAVAGSLVLPLAFGGVGTLHDLPHFAPAALATAAAAVLCSWLAKAVKFQLLARRIGHPRGLAAALAVSLGCDFAFAATPGGLGGYAATILLFGRVGVPAGAGAAIAAADQVLDLLFFALAMPLAALWLLVRGITPSPHANLSLPLLLLGAAVLAALGAGRIGRQRRAGLGQSLLRLPVLRRHGDALRRLWCEFCAHLRDLRGAPPGWTVTVLVVTIVQWLARYAVLGVVLAGFGYAVPGAVLLLLQAVALHAGQWTGIPGGVGGADVIVAQTLRAWVPLSAIGGSVLLWRLATFHLTLLGGGLASLCLIGAARRRRAASVSADATGAVRRA